MSRMKLGPAGAVRLIIVSTATFAAGLFIIMFLACPQVEMAGTINPDHNTLTVLNECNRYCGCSSDRKSYKPVCGSDNLTYFSSCFAGCSSFVNGTYGSCSCIQTDPENWQRKRSSPQISDDLFTTRSQAATARPGLCVPGCSLIIPYAITMFVMSLIGSMARVPATMVNFRIVDDDERSFALSINSFVMNLAGFVPAPILIGRLIDSSCRLWQGTAAIPPPSWSSSGCISPLTDERGTGSCLLFDTAKFRLRTYGVAFGFQTLDLVLMVVLYLLVRKRKFSIDSDDDVDETQTAPRLTSDIVRVVPPDGVAYGVTSDEDRHTRV